MEENGRMGEVKGMFKAWIEARRGVVESKGFAVKLEMGTFQVCVDEDEAV